MVIEKSVPRTLLACFLLTLLFMPVGLLGELLFRVIISLSQSFSRVDSDSVFPFGLFPETGAWILGFIKEIILVFIKVLLPLYFVSLIFRNSFNKIYWIAVTIFYFLFFCFTFYYFLPFADNPPTNKLVIYGTLVLVGVFQLISYYTLFHNKGSHQNFN